MKSRLQELYSKQIVSQMQAKFGYKNPLAVPRLTKIVVNVGIGEAASDNKIMEKSLAELSTITGQKPIIRRAKKAISNFKIKQGNPVGLKVTLRRQRMYEFLDRLVNVALPRIRDFRGVNPNSFDKGGNYSIGIAEQIIFPEIEFDRIERMQGMDITICTTSKTQQEAMELLKLFGMPFWSQEGR
jgi:large subunit ribosomal protein L5